MEGWTLRGQRGWTPWGSRGVVVEEGVMPYERAKSQPQGHRLPLSHSDWVTPARCHPVSSSSQSNICTMEDSSSPLGKEITISKHNQTENSSIKYALNMAGTKVVACAAQ